MDRADAWTGGAPAWIWPRARSGRKLCGPARCSPRPDSIARTETRRPAALGSRRLSDRDRAFEGQITGRTLPPAGGHRRAAGYRRTANILGVVPAHRPKAGMTTSAAGLAGRFAT